ncbi:EamA/RhaT family transporter [Stutzerimonas nosocomialis]|uniref:DMT family transporter n=1 Tax=Stutzerimonas nosocomialis TaxID=1056496 RepID=UPI001108C912|nr:EamA/RhaT family transporter [Stutzerimonas nosocomialis]
MISLLLISPGARSLITRNQPLLGVLLILSAGFLLAGHDGLSKHLSSLYPLFMVIWARYLSQSLLMVALFAPGMGRSIYRTQRPLLQLLRGLSLVGVSLLFIAGLHYIPLGEATAVIFVTPVLVTLASALLGERISAGQWLAVSVGLVGVLIIVRPGGALFSPAALLPLAAALCFTAYQLITRRLAGTDHPVTSNFLTSLVGAVLMSVPVVWQWTVPSLVDGLLMAALGAIAMTAHLLLTHAFRFASAATLAPFTYGQIVFAGVVGLLAFGHRPDAGALVGMAVIIASGLCMVCVQRRPV